jgi:hypothetical protein
MLYPEQLIDFEKLAYYFEGEWEQNGNPQEYIQPALQAFSAWVTRWLKNEVLFYYERGPGFLTLHDNRPLHGGDELQARKIVLSDVQSEIYLHCDGIRSFRSIQQLVEDRLSEEDTQSLLDQLVEHGLMFRENDLYLSLAVKCRSAFRQRHHTNGN